VYGSAEETEDTLRQRFGQMRDARLIRAAEEPDAPLEIDTSGNKPFAKAWLVSWKSEQDDEGS
jgi:hypothetical protein